LPHRRFRLHRTVEHVRRYRHIMAVLIKYGFAEVGGALHRRLASLLGRSAVPGRVKAAGDGRTRPARLRLALEEMGPMFIKLGQLLSTRPDLLPAEYIEELERLQDRVPPEKFPGVRAEIERQLGGSLESIFASFDPTPIAAGSIAQVHRATTRDGHDVVVKARRPGVVEKLRTDCEILENLAGLARSVMPDVDADDVERMVKDFTDAITKEVDLANERRNQLRFIRAFADDPTVHIPAVYEEYCSEGVLTTEYIEGLHPADAKGIQAAGLDRKALARRGADFVLRQIFELGFFHSDPHPGNFFFLPGNVVTAIDFGQTARMTSGDRALVRDLVLAIVEHDAGRLVGSLQRRGLLSDETDTAPLLRGVEELLDEYYEMPLKDIPLRKAIGEGFALIRKHHIHPPAEFTLMLKALMTIESFALSLDAEFDVLAHLRPYAARFKLQQLDPRRLAVEIRRTIHAAAEVAGRLPEDINAILGKFRRGGLQLHVHHEHLENLIRVLDKSSNRISFALIIAALLVGSSMLVSQQGLVLSFVRLQTLGVLGYVAAAAMGGWLLVSIIRSRSL
jgi:ubiquinone biosynthesis protein